MAWEGVAACYQSVALGEYREVSITLSQASGRTVELNQMNRRLSGSFNGDDSQRVNRN